MFEAEFVISIGTYGREPAYDKMTDRRVLTIKRTRAALDLLLTLFGARAKDLTPPQAHYRYVALDPMPTLRNNYLVLKLTATELAQVEVLTRQQPTGARVYLWRDGQWYEFPHQSPNGDVVDYQPSRSSGPTFSPASATAICPSQPEPQAAEPESITAIQSGDWWWIAGNTYPYRDRLKAAAACWSQKRQQWYVKGYTLPAAIATLIQAAKTTPADEPSTNTAHALVSADDVAPHSKEHEALPVPASQPTSTEPVQPRVEAKPVAITDAGGSIPQSYIGRVNVVGDCYCMGVVVDRRPPTYKNIPVYISVVGPATSVEALWAKLSQGKETAVIPEDRSQPTIYLEPNKGGLYTRYQKKIEALGVDHLALVHADMAEPSYPSAAGDKDETASTYLLCTSDEQRLAKLGEHVRKTVKVAVFDVWFDYLLTEGLARGLVRDCVGYGVQAAAVKLDAPRWTELIRDGLAKCRITLPG